jgi:hypothetical protein
MYLYFPDTPPCKEFRSFRSLDKSSQAVSKMSPQPTYQDHIAHYNSFSCILVLSFHVRPSVPSGRFPSGFPVKVQYLSAHNARKRQKSNPCHNGSFRWMTRPSLPRLYTPHRACHSSLVSDVKQNLFFLLWEFGGRNGGQTRRQC